MFLITLLAVVLILRKYLQQKELFLFGYLDCSVKRLIKISNVVIVDINGNLENKVKIEERSDY